MVFKMPSYLLCRQLIILLAMYVILIGPTYSITVENFSQNAIHIKDGSSLGIRCKTARVDWDTMSMQNTKGVYIQRQEDGDCVTIDRLIPLTHGLETESFGICLSINGYMYGGSELHHQTWPIKTSLRIPLQHYTTNDIVPFNESFGNVLERYWLTSTGYGIYVSEKIPVYATYNNLWSADKVVFDICLFPRTHVDITGKAVFNYELQLTVCKAGDILQTHRLMSDKFIKRPTGTPDTRMMKSPIWSTWAKYKTEIDQSKVLQYATEIVEHGFSNSQIEIDDMFSTFYGEFDFDPIKFPDAKAMISQLKQLGFRVTVWVTPFANLNSPAFHEGLDKGYWLKDVKGEVPALVKWWQGVGAILDVDNQLAVDWYIGRLEEMKTRYGVDSFKFDAGEVNFVPFIHEHTHKWVDPTVYTTKYVTAVNRMGSMIEVRCGYKTQQFPTFVRMGDKESRWGYDNGLRSLIPTMLTLGILGYPYILPDMIGGNGYVYADNVSNPFAETRLPDRELYIRWLQITAYMPAMQFSFVPWQYDQELVQIARKFVDIHENVVTPIVLDAAKVAQVKVSPIIRPLWWIAPTDKSALDCDTQFLVGNTLMVAPIVEQGAPERDIYLPEGLWEDELRGVTIHGGRWLYKYKVDIDQVPTFRKLE